MNRRSFIKKSSLGTAGVASSIYIPSFSGEKKIKTGLIGAGWYGMVITKAALKTGNVEVAAVCDVDSEHLKMSAGEIEKLQGSRPKEYKDYNDLLEQKGLEAIFIGTMPHWHALQFIAACEKGLHIYCEKPLAYDVREGEAMIKAANKAGNIVQIGFQRRQAESYKQVSKFIKEGKAGKVHQIEANIHYIPNFLDNTIQEPPSSLDWEMWCGPAPKLDYRPCIGHKAWRLEKEYGNGHLVDWGIHHIDIIRKIMDFGMPVSFETKGSLDIHPGKMTTPDTLTARMNFEGCPVTWNHRLWGTGELNPLFNNGITFYGEKATIFVNDNKIVVMPLGRNQTQEIQDIPTNDMQDKHVSNFVEAVKAGDKSMIDCPVEDAFQSTSTVQLAMISYYMDTEIKWNKSENAIIDDAEASKLLARQYRRGYLRPV